MTWKRYRFYTQSIEDCRPVVFNPKYPWWRSGFAEDAAVIVAYLPINEDLHAYWPDAYRVEFTEENSIEFTKRFAKPDYFEES
jgi:hypothetical protein